ncbi:MAG: CD1108 family mobile element protein, partial [Monoglobaceae bacterium]
MKDKEFKAKNKDTNFSKPQKTDTMLGRHNRHEEQKPDLSSLKKNRMYQQRQAKPEQPIDVTETKTDISQTSVSDTVNTKTENPVYEQNAFDTKESVVEKTEIHSEHHIEPTAPAESVKSRQRKQADKFRTNNIIPVSDERNAAETPIEKTETVTSVDTSIQTDIPTPAPKGERYNIQDAVSEKKQVFDVVEKNTDFKLGRQEHTVPKSAHDKKGIKPKNKNRLYQKEHIKADEAAHIVSSEQSAEPETVISDKSETAENAENLDEDIPTQEELQEDFQFDRTKKYEQRAEKLHGRAEKARNKAPHKKKIKCQRIYDEQKQKPRNRLQFENEPTPVIDNRYTFIKNSAAFAGNKVLFKAHIKILEVEHDNSAVEAAHKTEEQTERLAQHSMRVQKNFSGQRKNTPYKKAARLQQRAEKAEVKALYEKTLAECPELKKSEVKKFIQKQRTKKQYQKAKRAEHTAKQAKKAAQTAEKTARQAAAFIWRHKGVFGIIIAIVLIIAWLGSVLSSCSVMGTMGTNSLMVSSYFAEDEDIYAAEDYYVGLEQDLQRKISNIENEYSGYDEYNYNVAGIGHNPYELIS